MNKILLTLLFTFCIPAIAQNNQYPILKFKKDKIKLWSYPSYDSSLKVNVEELGDPKTIRFLKFTGSSNEHIVIAFKGKEYSFSKSKVVLSPDFDARNSTAMACSKTNLGKNETTAETTSVCEK